MKHWLSKCLLTMLPDLFLDKPSMLIASRPLEEDVPSEVHCCQGWGLIGGSWGWLGSNHPGRKFAPGAGTASIGLVRFAHRIAESGAGSEEREGLVHSLSRSCTGAWENFTTSMAQFLTVAFNETLTFKVFADNASRSFSWQTLNAHCLQTIGRGCA